MYASMHALLTRNHSLSLSLSLSRSHSFALILSLSLARSFSRSFSALSLYTYKCVCLSMDINSCVSSLTMYFGLFSLSHCSSSLPSFNVNGSTDTILFLIPVIASSMCPNRLVLLFERTHVRVMHASSSGGHVRK